MGKIILTERQYNDLLRKNLSESVVYEDIEDQKDVPINLKITLTMVSDLLNEKYKKDLYVKSIKNGIITLNSSKYNEEEKDFIITTFKTEFENTTKENEKFKDEKNLVIDYGVDTDFEDFLSSFENEKQKRIELEKIKQNSNRTVSRISSSEEFSGVPNYWLPLVNLIAKGESTSYTSLYPSTTLEEKGLENGTTKTISDVKKFLISKGMSDNAVGRWQIKNLINQSEAAGLNPDNDPFSVENQNKILLYLIQEKRDVTPQSIKSDLIGSAKRLAQEWSSLPVLEDTNGVKRGESYYGGKTKITADEFQKVLSDMSNIEYQPSDNSEKSERKNIGSLVIRLLNNGKQFNKEINYYPNCLDKGVLCMGGSNGDWGGSVYKSSTIAYYLNNCDSRLKPSSQKRYKERTDDGNVSDHWGQSNNTYAIDFPVSSEQQGDEAFYCLKNTLINKGYISKEDAEKKIKIKKGHYSNFNYGGYRYQIIWKSDKQHKDHIHIGVSKI